MGSSGCVECTVECTPIKVMTCDVMTLFTIGIPHNLTHSPPYNHWQVCRFIIMHGIGRNYQEIYKEPSDL